MESPLADDDDNDDLSDDTATLLSMLPGASVVVDEHDEVVESIHKVGEDAYQVRGTADLEDLFRDLAANISKTGATDIVIKEKLTDDFEIVDVDPPAKGTAIITGVFILFQYGWMHGSYGVNIVGMVVILLGYSLVLFTGQLTAMTIYCLTSGSDKKRRVAPVGIRGADYPP